MAASVPLAALAVPASLQASLMARLDRLGGAKHDVPAHPGGQRVIPRDPIDQCAGLAYRQPVEGERRHLRLADPRAARIPAETS
jgi:hypothetical protein